MGYACPVCETPEADGRHLANHLAFTALTGGGAHEDWLDEHVPEWGQLGEDALAEQVVPVAEETDVADVFEEEAGETPPIDPHPERTPAPVLDEEAADIVAEAQEYTRTMAGEGADDRAGEDTDTATGDETE